MLNKETNLVTVNKEVYYSVINPLDVIDADRHKTNSDGKFYPNTTTHVLRYSQEVVGVITDKNYFETIYQLTQKYFKKTL